MERQHSEMLSAIREEHTRHLAHLQHSVKVILFSVIVQNAISFQPLLVATSWITMMAECKSIFDSTSANLFCVIDIIYKLMLNSDSFVAHTSFHFLSVY